MKPYLQDPDMTVYHGDCLEVMAQLAEASVDAVVTDPPAGIAFMSKSWDSDKGGRDAWVAWLTQVMAECLRVLKPGGHALVWALPRTSHWTGWAIEEAGFKVRDRVTHLFGQGFPKGTAIDKAIDREAGADREVVGRHPHADKNQHRSQASTYGAPTHNVDITAPATPEAASWQGWNTTLKPAAEDWWLARKPLAERTVARQVLATGTGAINVDGCRINLNGETWSGNESNAHEDYSGEVYGRFGKQYAKPSNPAGRWPPNVVLDEAAAEVLDAEIGERPSGARAAGRYGGIGTGPIYGEPGAGEVSEKIEANDGGPSRFFKVTRGGEASADHRYGDTGATDLAALPGQRRESAAISRFFYTAKASSAEREGSRHPTVKPLDLMRFLVRMVCPPGGLVLDPFAGSGTTGLACRQEGMRAILIEREVEYLPDIARRLRQLSLFGDSA